MTNLWTNLLAGAAVLVGGGAGTNYVLTYRPTNHTYDIRVTNWSRLDPKIVQQWCAEHGGHCFTNSGAIVLTGNPPSTHVTCKHCGHADVKTLQFRPALQVVEP